MNKNVKYQIFACLLFAFTLILIHNKLAIQNGNNMLKIRLGLFAPSLSNIHIGFISNKTPLPLPTN